MLIIEVLVKSIATTSMVWGFANLPSREPEAQLHHAMHLERLGLLWSGSALESGFMFNLDVRAGCSGLSLRAVVLDPEYCFKTC